MSGCSVLAIARQSWWWDGQGRESIVCSSSAMFRMPSLDSVEPTGRQPRTMHAQIERSVHVAKARKRAVEKTIVVKGNVLTSLPASS